MASSSFRDSMNSLGWSRRDPDLPINTAQQTGGLLSSIKSLNPFGDSGYVRLPTTEGAGAPLPGRNRREEEEGWFVDLGFNVIPRIMGRDDGPVDVHEPPDISATPSIYGDLFWIDRVDPILQSGASKQASDIDLGDYSNNMLDLVSCQLLSHGVQRSSIRNELWSQSSGCVDVRIGSWRRLGQFPQANLSKLYSYTIVNHLDHFLTRFVSMCQMT
ncbi:hypothetical protein DSL72_004956 [Monilinia vaccinii-corymbosi]|uniref:Uncharacterized protein n=1 Tax=Monilinia vaccinii-corymbosi TaxID=61207 RepID=A0A8A3NY28_9HELO|nr:hypothetical protein DSL72_004956 [Monilinia vaccinii-corymbosi]